MSIDFTSVNHAIERWGKRKDFLIEVLQDLQDHYRYLPEPILAEVSKQMEIPLNHIYEVATFYKAFSLVPKGKYVINVCLGTACHVLGAVQVLSSFEREMGIKVGETDKQLHFTLDTVRCIGCCGLAPVVTVNEDVHGKLTADKVENVVKRYQKEFKKETEKKSE
ncbi:MAG: hypothetical protein A2Y62_08195 [Candidatus Fischerbacteria bacterium RBG_13_37_8]|uniref:NADH dehydrogenase n=1 Tax=Candidatus Fischerbacteria bacterium RBG_13_37_8 TaxID=1817863 RepID=A0A1F5V8I6_9BACT|nr:MAG: hypothetical protein A2Y62_08195 [Candidatus Fischerbacteria bacterium RBG_13_37_8]